MELFLILLFIFPFVIISLLAKNNGLFFKKFIVPSPFKFIKAITFLWSFKEMRTMVSACIVIFFASILLPSKIEIKVTHDFAKNKMTINHDLSGNLNSPINLKLSDPGYPIKVEVSNR